MRRPIELPLAPNPDPFEDPVTLAVVQEVLEHGEAASEAGVIARAGIPRGVFGALRDGRRMCRRCLPAVDRRL
jgi:hypothetical protein